MKGFTWNIKSISQFKEVVRDEFGKIIVLDNNDINLTEVELDYIADAEKKDSLDAIKKGSTDISEKDVTYYINNYGARGDWNIDTPKDDHLKIGVFGCSFTFGIGIPENKTWSYQLRHKLKTDKPIQIINLGFPGGSISKVLKLFKYLTDVYKIDIAVFLLPSHWREEHPVSYTTELFENLVAYHNLIPNYTLDIIMDKCEEFYTYSTEETRFYSMLRNISYIELIASVNNIETYYSSWDFDTLNFLKENKVIKDNQVLPYFKFLENGLVPGLSNKFARDGQHPGIASQDLFANELSDHICRNTLIQGLDCSKLL